MCACIWYHYYCRFTRIKCFTFFNLFFTIGLFVLPFIKVISIHFRVTLGLIWLFGMISGYDLINLVMTHEFHTNYPNLSKIHIFLICLGTARFIIGIFFNQNKSSYFDEIKNIVKERWPYIKQNKGFCLSIGIAVCLLVIISTNLYCWCLGLILCTNSYFTFYIFLLTKLILINSTISLIMLTFTPIKEWYNIIGMSIWLPLVLIATSVFYYFYILPELIKIKLVLIDIIQIRPTNFEQSWYEFKLAIIYKVDDIKITLSHLKEGWFYLNPPFFFKYKKSRWTINKHA